MSIFRRIRRRRIFLFTFILLAAATIFLIPILLLRSIDHISRGYDPGTHEYWERRSR